MTARSYRVHVLDMYDAWREWINSIPVEPGENPHFARVRHIEQTGETALHLAVGQFFWLCPGCGLVSGGTLGEQPVSGWDNPCWTLAGNPECPTLFPSLGCPTWRRGDCDGHWWLREGVLVPA